jgi:anti-sigma factor RsiW
MNTPDKNSDKNSDKHDELRQQLWELSYGLLEPEAEAAVRAQIKSDPAIARLYSEVRLQADLVGAAARVQDSSMHIAAGPDAKVTKVDAKKSSKHPSRKSTPVAGEARGWNTNWLAIGGTVALIALLAFGLYLPQQTTSRRSLLPQTRPPVFRKPCN